jgi:hypothetical protein
MVLRRGEQGESRAKGASSEMRPLGNAKGGGVPDTRRRCARITGKTRPAGNTRHHSALLPTTDTAGGHLWF